MPYAIMSGSLLLELFSKHAESFQTGWLNKGWVVPCGVLALAVHCEML